MLFHRPIKWKNICICCTEIILSYKNICGGRHLNCEQIISTPIPYIDFPTGEFIHIHIICASYLYIIINKHIFKKLIFINTVLTHIVFYIQCMFESCQTIMKVQLIILLDTVYKLVIGRPLLTFFNKCLTCCSNMLLIYDYV